MVGRGDSTGEGGKNRASLGSCEHSCRVGSVLGTGRRGAGWWEQTEGTGSCLPDLGIERAFSG